MEVMNNKDFKEIGAVLYQLKEAFTTHDAHLLEDVYADDVRWTNAFGKSIKGKSHVIQYWEGLFKESRFTAGKLKGEPTVEFDVISENVIVVTVSSEIIGQKTIEGEIALRRNFSLKVLKKTADGWRIASEMYMDAREETTLES